MDLSHFQHVIYNVLLTSLHHVCHLLQRIVIYLSCSQLEPATCTSPTFSPSWNEVTTNRSQDLEPISLLYYPFFKPTTPVVYACQLVAINASHSGGHPWVKDTTLRTLKRQLLASWLVISMGPDVISNTKLLKTLLILCTL